MIIRQLPIFEKRLHCTSGYQAREETKSKVEYSMGEEYFHTGDTHDNEKGNSIERVKYGNKLLGLSIFGIIWCIFDAHTEKHFGFTLGELTLSHSNTNHVKLWV